MIKMTIPHIKSKSVWMFSLILTWVVEVDAAQVGEQVLQGLLGVLHGVHAVFGQDQCAQARVQPPELPDLGPVLQLVVGDLQQAQGRAGRLGLGHGVVAVQAEEELLQPAGDGAEEENY